MAKFRVPVLCSERAHSQEWLRHEYAQTHNCH
jgi:hypothetical protein